MSTRQQNDVRLKKYVMLVDSGAGPLGSLIPRLRELDYRVITVPSAADAAEMLRAFPKLSLVAINESLDVEGSRALLATLREVQPQLPVLWHGPGTWLGRDSGGAFATPPRADEVTGRVTDIVESQGYSVQLMRALAEAAVESMRGFGVHCCARDPFLKGSRMELAELSALIAFSGSGRSGHLVVSSTREVARRAYLLALSSAPRAGDEDLGDLLGEICNRIAGPLMQHVSPEDAAPSLGVPLLITSQGGALWEASRRPSLGLELEGATGPFFVELSMEGRPRPETEAEIEVPAELLKTGEFILL